MLGFIKSIVGWILIVLHKLVGREDAGIVSILFHNPSEKVFEGTIKWLKRHRYRIISLDQLSDLTREKTPLNKLAVITFDDGWKGNLNLLKIIEDYRAPIAIFVPADAVSTGNYWFEFARMPDQEKLSGISDIKEFKRLPFKAVTDRIEILKRKYALKRSCVTLEELREISKHQFITIGSHTVNHPILKNCSPEDQYFELSHSKSQIEEWLGMDIKYFAYPNGDFNDSTLEIVERVGYNLCFTVEPKKINIQTVNPYAIPRCAIEDNGAYFENIAKMLGLWQKYL